MLKIKSNIDLKELEKYGFHQGYNQHNDNNKYYGVHKTDDIRVNHEDKTITCGNLWISSKSYYSWDATDKLYNLIKDGLVEKVDND